MEEAPARRRHVPQVLQLEPGVCGGARHPEVHVQPSRDPAADDQHHHGPAHQGGQEDQEQGDTGSHSQGSITDMKCGSWILHLDITIIIMQVYHHYFSITWVGVIES